MQKWLDKIDQVNEWIGQRTTYLSLLLVVLVFANVFMRYVLNMPMAWTKELEWHLFALLFLISAGYSLKHNKHVRVDLFYDKMNKQDQARVDFWGTLLFLIPWTIVLLVTGWRSATDAYRLGERSIEAGGLSNLWLIQFAIPVGMFLLLLQGISLLLRSWKRIKS